MRRCIALAQRAAGYNQPNPPVGALLVHEGRIIGEGWHALYGQAHAEVNAVKNVEPQDAPLLPLSTIYVTLEPCHHTGKTPPCVDLLLRCGIRRVVVAMQDPFELVAGKSIEKLRAAGVEVRVGVCEQEARHLIRRFLTMVEKKRPHIVLKFAQSADGFLSRKGEQTRISSAIAQRLTHAWRGEEQAILVGSETVLVDNPQLNNRFGARSPLRLVVDRRARLDFSQNYHIFDSSQPTWIFRLSENGQTENQEIRPNLRLVLLPSEREDSAFLRQLLDYLQSQKIQSLLVEGGAALLESFLRAQLFDEVRQIIARPLHLGSGLPAPCLRGLREVSRQPIDEADELRCFLPFA